MYLWQSRLLNLIFPPRCPFCRDVIAETQILCTGCAKKFLPHEQIFRLQGETPFADIVCISLFPYRAEVRDAILAFKFQGFRSAARGFGMLMANAVQINGDGETVVTFVPMDRSRQQERGYNQAQLLAREVAAQLVLPCQGLLRKTRATAQQHTLSREERKKNARDAFAAEKNTHGKHVILCDDIITTGETLRECVRVLIKEGAKSVVCVTIAHAGS